MFSGLRNSARLFLSKPQQPTFIPRQFIAVRFYCTDTMGDNQVAKPAAAAAQKGKGNNNANANKGKKTLKEIRILMLHGYTQSGPLFRAKTRALEKLLAKTLAPAGLVPVCIYPTAPNRLYARDIPGFHQVPEGSGEQEEEEIDSWAWFRKDEASGQYRLLSEGMMALADTMRAANSPGAQVVDGEVVVKTLVGDAAGVVEGEAGEQGKEGEKKKHIDGVIGFSQGGAMAAMLASALEFTLGETHRALPKTDKSAAAAWAEALRSANNDVPLKFAVSYSGFYGVPEDLNWLYEPKIKTPTLHFLGSLDTVVDESRSQGLIDRCEDPVVVVHPGGHYVPINKEWVMPLVGFIQNCCLVDQKPKKEEKEDTDEEFPF